MTGNKKTYADHTGILASALCLVHCLAAPVLVFIGAGIVTNPVFSYLFVIVSFVSIWKAARASQQKKLNTLLWVAFIVFGTSIIFEEQYHWLHYTGYFSSATLVVGHALRLRSLKTKRRQPETLNALS